MSNNRDKHTKTLRVVYRHIASGANVDEPKGFEHGIATVVREHAVMARIRRVGLGSQKRPGKSLRMRHRDDLCDTNVRRNPGCWGDRPWSRANHSTTPNRWYMRNGRWRRKANQRWCQSCGSWSFGEFSNASPPSTPKSLTNRKKYTP